MARARQALQNSELGALLVFDNNNIRYLTSTAIGEWARDKMCRFAVLAGDGEPHLWDFGSAAAHHRIYAPWLQPICCHAGMVGLRGTVPPDAGLVKRAALEIKAVLDENGVGKMPLGVDVVEPPMLFELQKLGIEVRDGQQTLLDAREIKSRDEIMLLNTAASMVDGVYQMIYEQLKPGVRESDIVARVNKMLYEMGSDDVEAVNAVAGERCSPHPHNFTDRIVRPGDQAFFDIIQAYMGYRTCYYRTFNVGKATPAQHDAYQQSARLDGRRDRARAPGRRHRSDRGASFRRRRSSAFRTRWKRSRCSSATGWASRCTSGRSSAAWSPSTIRTRSRPAWCSRSKRIVRPPTGARRRASKKRWS